MSLQLASSVGNSGVVVSSMFSYGRFRSESGGIYGVPTSRRDRGVSVHTTNTGRSQSQGRSHLSHDENTRAMQLEIDLLKRKLRHERQR